MNLNTTAHIGVVDDHPAVLEALRLLLEHEGFRVTTLEHPRLLNSLGAVDLVLLDMNFSHDTTSGLEGLAAMRVLAETLPEVPVILMTAWASVDRAVEAMKLGARDYLTKPWNNERLLAACRAQTELRRAAVVREQNARDVRTRRAALDASHSFEGIIGDSASMVNVLQMVADVAPTTASVLITGPAGTGKELIAQAIHKNSARASRPFVAVHVGALAEGLFERELFGHVRGAFTDARDDRPGRFALADQGTLFLDEIGTLKPSQQLKLLRVLQEGEFEPLGSTRTQHVDVRVIAATNVDLQAEMAAGRFREDLYYRLQVVELYLQPLRDRPDDILPCAYEFLRRSAARSNKPITGFAPAAERALLAYSWPGNIRELENLVERAVIFSRGTLIETIELPVAATSVSASSLTDVERAAVVKALAVHQGNISHAAAALGLSRAALYRRIAKYGLQEPRGRETGSI